MGSPAHGLRRGQSGRWLGKPRCHQGLLGPASTPNWPRQPRSHPGRPPLLARGRRLAWAGARPARRLLQEGGSGSAGWGQQLSHVSRRRRPQVEPGLLFGARLPETEGPSGRSSRGAHQALERRGARTGGRERRAAPRSSCSGDGAAQRGGAPCVAWTISCGIAAIVLSRYLSQKSLGWAVFSLSITSSLLSLFCLVGLAVAIGLTFANRGHALLSVCTFADMEVIQITHECPFDPTRIYSSALVLWGLSFLLDSVEILFSIRCFLITLTILNLKLCPRRRRKRKKKISLTFITAESRDACEGRDLLRMEHLGVVTL
uniref:Transmembrane protein 54 n=1 Tax=Laticauda laticaudata TaxID=8630 RepID=A0A8C5RHF3_LATLA